MLVGKVCRRHILLVFSLQIHSLLDEEVHHVILIPLDGIVDRSLVLEVSQVMIGPSVDQVLGDLDLAFPHTVVKWCLSILVLPIDLGTLVNQQLTHWLIAFPGGIKERTLLE